MFLVTNRTGPTDHVMPSPQKLQQWRAFVMCPCLSEFGTRDDTPSTSTGLGSESSLNWICFPLKQEQTERLRRKLDAVHLGMWQALVLEHKEKAFLLIISCTFNFYIFGFVFFLFCYFLFILPYISSSFSLLVSFVPHSFLHFYKGLMGCWWLTF